MRSHRSPMEDFASRRSRSDRRANEVQNLHVISHYHGPMIECDHRYRAEDREAEEKTPLSSSSYNKISDCKPQTTVRQTDYVPGLESDNESDHYFDTRLETRANNSGNGWFSQRFGAPSWTHPVSILGFCIAFIATIASLLITLHLSNTHKGFSISRLSSPFVWRYVPTAVFTIVIALWRQVDYTTKASAPWLELSKGYQKAHKTYLLDYNSPILPSALYLSVKNRHWRVVATITIFGLLKIIVVFSTGLLAFQNTSLLVSDYSVSLKQSNGMTNYGTYSSFYVEEVYGSLASNLSFQPGTSKTAAFQELSSENSFPAQAVVTAEVLGFFPSLTCEDAVLSTYWQNVTDDRIIPNVTTGVRTQTNTMSDFMSKSCNGTVIFDIVDLLCDYATPTWTCASKVIYNAGIYGVSCPDANNLGNTEGYLNAFLIAAAAFAPDPIQRNRSTKSPFTSWSTGILCRPSYGIELAQLLVDTSATDVSKSSVLSAPITSTGQQLANYTNSDLAQDIVSIVVAGSGVTPALPQTYEEADYDAVDAWFQLMLYDLSANQLDIFRNTTVLQQSAANVFQILAAQWVGSWLSFPDNLDGLASYTYEEQRLRVQPQATFQMCAGLAVTAMIGLALLLGSTRVAAFKLPKSLSAVAVLIKSSLGIEHLLFDASNMSDKQLSVHLQPWKFSVEGVLASSPKKDVYRSFVSGAEPSLSQPLQNSFWVPMSATRWFAILCVCITLCEFTVLEALQRQSNRHHGFCDVTASPEVSHQIITILSALIMALTAAMFSATEWAVGVFAPFHLLKKRICRLKEVDNNDFTGLAPIALVKAARYRQIAVSILLIATIIGSMLTIAVSGLYTIESSPRVFEINAYSASQFNTSWSETDQSTRATMNTFTLIYAHNASEPEGTYQEITYPKIRLNETDTNVARILGSKNVADSFVDIYVPVLRASLNCSVIPQEAISYYVKPATLSATLAVSPVAKVNATFNLPRKCQFSSGQYQNSTQVLATYSDNIPTTVNSSWLDGRIMDVTGLGAAFTYETYYSWPEYCPSLGFIVGRFANDTSPAEKTVMVCTQLQEEIPARVRLNVPSLSRDVRSPIDLDESQAKVVSGYQYQFSDPLPHEDFYTTLSNITGLQLDDLVGAENIQKMINATQHVYRLYMAQAFSAGMRMQNLSSVDTNINTNTFPINSLLRGTISDPTGVRIVQNNRSKIILQCFLAIMTICYITAYMMINMRETLPHNPCTIAGAMSLLAGSRFAEEAFQIAQEKGKMNEPGRRLADSKLRMGRCGNKEGDDSKMFEIDFAECL